MNNNKIKQIVDEAKKVLPCVWPLKSFIATNPLWDLTDKPFVAAIGEMSQYVDVSAGQTVADYHAYYVNGKYTSADIVHAASLVMKWDQADSLQFSRHIFRDDMIHSLMMFEEANAAAALPATLVIEQIAANHDADLLRLMKKDIHAFYARYLSKKQYSSLLAAWCQENDCNEPIATHYIAQRFEKLGLDETSAIYYTRKLLSSTIGYAGLVKWLESRPDNPLFQSDACLVEMIAVWLLYEEQIEKRYPQFVFSPALTGSLNDAFKPLPATFSFGLSTVP